MRKSARGNGGWGLRVMIATHRHRRGDDEKLPKILLVMKFSVGEKFTASLEGGIE